LVEALVLDSEAINALARSSVRGALAHRARAILQVAYDERALVRVPAPVLAEVCRGDARDGPVNLVLNGNGIGVVDLTARIARRAGALLARRKLSSEHAVDAFVVATALEFRSSVIGTGDVRDITRLSSGYAHLRVFGI
jgi:hypothetical protein